MKVVIAGGTGLIGKALVKRLAELNRQVVILTRDPDTTVKYFPVSVEVESWDGKTIGSWSRIVDGANVVINLAGESVAAKRWTPTRKASIMNSRIDSTRVIVDAIGRTEKKPQLLINASAVGYYGNVESGDVVETYPAGNDFIADVCKRWEAEALQAERFGLRVVLLRIGIVLDNSGGALKRMMFPYKLYIGGRLGSGRQRFPWIHLNDVVGVILFAMENKNLSGPVNVASPEPVTMKEFSTALGRTMGRPAWLSVPAFVLKIGLGELAGMLLGGQRTIPQKLINNGFTFRYPYLDEALRTLLKNK